MRHPKLLKAVTPIIAVAAIVLDVSNTAWAAQASIYVGSAQSAGFSDTTPAEPVAGNYGTTIGQQRRIAFRYAIDMVASKLVSSTPIVVRAIADNSLPCSKDGGLIGRGGPTAYSSNFAGAAYGDTQYPAALASALAGHNMRPHSTSADVNVRYNPRLGTPNCLAKRALYYGLDGRQPDLAVNFVNVVAHEMIHGLGFLSSVDKDNGYFSPDPTILDRMIYDTRVNDVWTHTGANERAVALNNPGSLAFNGPLTRNQGSPALRRGTAGDRARIYSNANHWSRAVRPHQLMEPLFPGGIHAEKGLGLATCALSDMGWKLTQGTHCPGDTTYEPGLSARPNAADFKSVATGESSTQTIRLINQDTQSVAIKKATSNNTNFAVDSSACRNAAIRALSSCELAVTFKPQNSVRSQGQIALSTSAGALKIKLSGNTSNGADDSAAGENSDGGSGGGGGCTIARHEQPFDPIWIVLQTLAIGVLWRRRGLASTVSRNQ